ncbi:MAG: hypothetical protein SGILL_002455 [Bacillariaceae sp.]
MDIKFANWVDLCQSLAGESFDNLSTQTEQLIKDYTDCSSVEDAVKDLKDAQGIVTADDLSNVSTDDETGYRYGSNGGKMLAPSKASSFRSSSQRSEGEVYTRADGKKVRRIKKSASSSGASLQGSSDKKSLSGFLSQGDSGKGESKLAKLSGSRSVAGGEGEVYVRADGKKVSEDPSKKSLSGFLEKSDKPKLRVGGSASVAGDQIAVSKESSLTGEVYVRADGKKVRRVKKSSASSVSGDDSSEIITKPDGTKVRRIRKTKASGGSSSSSVVESTTKEQPASGGGLAGFFGKSPKSSKSRFSGSQSVGGDHLEGEIYVRADGKKVRRVRKAKGSGASLSGFLDSESTEKPKHSGAATVVGDVGRASTPSEKSETTEIYIRPDGTIAVSKESSLTGEVYVRADGKKVRRVKKAAASGASVSGSSAAAPGDNVEIITRPDGTKVRRIRKTKPKPVDDSVALSGFLDSQPKSAPRGGGATVAGDRVSSNEIAGGKENGVPQSPAKAKDSLDGFLGKMDSKPKKLGGSASVAGDQIAVSKDSSLTGEVYVRADGKKGKLCTLYPRP